LTASSLISNSLISYDDFFTNGIDIEDTLTSQQLTTTKSNHSSSPIDKLIINPNVDVIGHQDNTNVSSIWSASTQQQSLMMTKTQTTDDFYLVNSLQESSLLTNNNTSPNNITSSSISNNNSFTSSFINDNNNNNNNNENYDFNSHLIHNCNDPFLSSASARSPISTPSSHNHHHHHHHHHNDSSGEDFNSTAAATALLNSEFNFLL
jgi:hypothetical protein